jgi:hypothetical protein
MDHLDLESSINDVTDMAAISDLLTAKFTEAIHDTLRSGEVSGKQAIERHEWLSALVSFAVLETKLKAEALRKQFYAKPEEG